MSRYRGNKGHINNNYISNGHAKLPWKRQKQHHHHHHQQNQHDKTFSRDHTSKVFWEPGILTGYRPANQPWMFYVKSLFWIHNESVNVWTHLLGPAITLPLVYSFSRDMDFFTDPSTHGLLIFAVTSTLSFATSCLAHLLHNKSELMHYFLFSIDYIGIALYGYGYGIMLYYCSGNQLFYSSMGTIFPIIHSLLASNVTLCNIASRTLYKNRQCRGRKCLQVIPTGISVICTEVVLLFRLYSYMTESDHFTITHTPHLYHLIFTVTNGIHYSFHQPERAYPGRFDIFGHGHQWFHLSVILCACTQLYACYVDLLTLPKSVLLLAEPDPITMWGNLAAIFLLNVFVLIVCYPKLKRLVVSCD